MAKTVSGFHQKFYTEVDLRRWLRKVWKRDLSWVEVSMGGTAGVPDVIISLGNNYYLPTELKVGKRNKNGKLRVHIRPSQIRYHLLADRAGVKTAVLIMIEDQVYFMPGSCADSIDVESCLTWVGKLGNTSEEAKCYLIKVLMTLWTGQSLTSQEARS